MAWRRKRVRAPIFARAPTCDPDSNDPRPNMPGPNLNKRAYTNILAHTSTGVDHGRRMNTRGRNIFLGCKQPRGSACGRPRPESKSCLLHHRRPAGPLSKHHGVPRPRPWPPRAMRFRRPQSHHPKWHAPEPPAPQPSAKDRQEPQHAGVWRLPEQWWDGSELVHPAGHDRGHVRDRFGMEDRLFQNRATHVVWIK